MRSRGPKLASVVSLLLLPTAPAANAEVLVSRPASSIRCGEPIKTGIWYRDFPTRGSHEATIEIRSAANSLLSRRTVTATDVWRYFRYTPRCGRHYRIRYVTATSKTTFKVWVRRP